MTDDGRSVKNINILLLFYGDDAKSIGIKYDEKVEYLGKKDLRVE